MEFEPFNAKASQLSLSFNNISYSVRSGLFSKEWKNLLSDISGDFRPGELTAIMGLSGAGKSTLMDILAGFTTAGVTGEVLVNDRKRNHGSFRRSSAYIMQDDHLQPLLTVAEAMQIAADLKLESSVSSLDKKHGIEVILREMSLDHALTTRTSDLSGGEKKRLAIALELISNPPVMFFDEPTSGLDIVTSRRCLGLLKSLARQGRTIVCVIHQPSASLFDMIDHLYVVHKGHCAYAGSAHNLISFFRSCDLRCPVYHDPADFLLEILNGDYGEEHVARLIGSSENGKCQRWRSDSAAAAVAGSSTDANPSSIMHCREFFSPKLPMSATPIAYESRSSASSAHSANGFFWQLWILLRCNLIKLSRHRVLLYVRLMMHFLIGLLVGWMYYQIGQDAAFVIDNIGLLFFTMMFVSFNGFTITYITFSDELPILTREHFNRWYKLHSFYIANKLADLPVQAFACASYAIIVYQMSGQVFDYARLALFTCMCLMASLVAQMIGLIIGTALSIQNAVMFGPLTMVPSMVFSGYFVYLTDAPRYIQWLFHVSFLKYGFEGIVVAVYGYDRERLNCSADYCHFRLPKTVLQTVDMINSSYWTSAIFMIGLYIALDVLAYFVLRMRLKRRKH